MAFGLEISALADSKFAKMARKDKKSLEAINAKIGQILENPEHFKPLRGDMHGARRVHINTSFILIYEIDKKNSIVRILDYAPHDKVYG